MSKQNLNLIVLLFLLIACITCCSKKKEQNQQETGGDVWDIDKDGIPKFVEMNYIELAKIYRISKFRSSEGHDYSDAFEHCRSMKHYFEPKGDIDWSAIKLFSPVKGKITKDTLEWAGTQLEIASIDYPAFRFSIFHINTSVTRNIGDTIAAGELLGKHIGSQTMSDIAVMVNDPTHQGRLVSYFEVITDAVFKEFSNRGLKSREDMIIPKAVRDANPISCNGDTFTTTDTLENWFVLN